MTFRTKQGIGNGLRLVVAEEAPVNLAHARALRWVHPEYRGLDLPALRLRLAREIMEADPGQLVSLTYPMAGYLSARAGGSRSGGAPG